jgi:SNF2 family DNA or RNA helicase
VNGPEELNSVAAAAEQLQPTGITLDSTTVKTPIPFLLKHKLREYQHIGLDWLVTMHDKTLNGILADEMGLGKTMQTIALLAHLACERGIWGPHLIVVPTSVVLNWEMEFKKWCPAFKILTYWGSIKERKLKRQGWTKHNTFHICITSYKLIVQDNHIFRRKKWKYFILDEAQNIKNFKSQRWQVLLNFNSQRRLLLTGTPLQNSLMELWSLMHFLMPHVFTSHQEFREWFSNPLTGMIEGSREYNESLVKRLHKVLRPFLLRRLKSEVEKQLPNKYEHVIECRLSKRQRFLYDDFMARTKTKETLASGNFLSVINILMQLRKVCNHPDLFETRPIVSPLIMEGITFYTASLVVSALDKDPFDIIDLPYLNVSLIDFDLTMDAFSAHRTHGLQTPKKLIVDLTSPETTPTGVTPSHPPLDLSTPIGVTPSHPPLGLSNDSPFPDSPGLPLSSHDGGEMAMFNHLASHSSRQYSTRAAATMSSQEGGSLLQSLIMPRVVERRAMTLESRQEYIHRVNTRRCSRWPLYGLDTRSALDMNRLDNKDDPFDFDSSCLERWSWQARSHHACALRRTELMARQLHWVCTERLREAICTPCDRARQLEEILKRFIMWIPTVESSPIVMHASHTPPSRIREQALYHTMLDKELSRLPPLLHPVTTAMMLQFPETRLIQYDCGKLQTLDRLLHQLKLENHRVLIFTQMTRMLDILEAFLNYHGHTYFRLDGSTRIDRRQQLMDHFNMDKRIFCFILSTRSGGIGVNLTGADTVIFYDSDWNPTMDAQAQDRCHRIGQTRDVSIYRLISEHTVEENILKKAKQKRLLGDLAIEGGSFTTEFFKQRDIRDIFNLEGESKDTSNAEAMSEAADMTQKQLEEALAGAEDDQDVLAAHQATLEQVAELAEFSETATDETQGESQSGGNEAEPELSQTEQKLADLQEQLTPVERRCVYLVEESMSEYMDWQLKAAENQVEHDKKNWELSHLQALKQAEELKAEEEDELMLTFSQEDIQDKCFIRLDTGEEMPIWMPPTPPEDGKDEYYVDYTLALIYGLEVMDESELPTVYMARRNEDGHIQKKKRLDPDAIAAAWKVNLPDNSELQGLRERPVPLPSLPARKVIDSDGKGRRQSLLPSSKKLKLKIPNILSTKGSAYDEAEWTIADDWALLQVVPCVELVRID